MMNNIILPNGSEISNIVLGTGGPISSDELLRLLDKYYELGGRTVDTARMYDQLGEKSESVIGRWLRTRGVRADVTLVTKGGFPRERMTYEALHDDIERSLDALKTVPDLYLFHRDNPDVPVDEFVDIASDFIDSGYTRLYGVSNWDNDRITAASDYAEGCAKPAPSLSQIQWSLAETTGKRAGDETLICMNKVRRAQYEQSGMPIMAFAPQAKGFFSKFASGAPFSDKVISRFLSDSNLCRAERVSNLADSLGVSAAAIALGYIISSGIRAACVVGCRNEEQLADSMTALEFRLDTNKVKWLEGE